MSKIIIILLTLLVSSNAMAQQVLQTENTLSVEDLIRDEFIKGNCRNVSNIISIGDPDLSLGQFNNGTSSINLEDGIILSTGDIQLAQGPNNSNEASHSFNTFSDDADLNALATGLLFDVTGIEFDFVPLGNEVQFRYVFASEEYCEFVGTGFNDVFGFFVSGPGINGIYANNAINVATLGGTDVSINNVNHLDNSAFYVNNINSIDVSSCDLDFNPTFLDLIEYDGFTVPLVASFPVVPCETYHIRLVIGDVGDAILDSAVFLEANSFDLGEEVDVRAEVFGRQEPIAYESCVDAQFVFTRSGSIDIDEPLLVEYTISPDSEATNGVDFLEIPLSITIPAGETEFILPIIILDDNIVEGPENLKLIFTYDCDCLDPSLSELIINDPVENLSANFDDIEVCANQLFRITPNIIDGTPPFEFLWDNGVTSEVLEANVTIPTQLGVTVTDFCGNTGSAVANIGIQDIPTATLNGTFDLCQIRNSGIPVTLAGNPPWQIHYSIEGELQAPIENIEISPFILEVPTAGTYELIAFNDVFCEGIVMGGAEVESTFSLETSVTPPSCFNSSDGSIQITEIDAIAPFFVQWNVATENDNLISNLEEGIYNLRITDANGCTYDKSFELIASSKEFKDCTPIYVPNIFSPNDDGVNDKFSIFVDPLNQVQTIVSFQVYSRWGELMFKETDFIPDNGITGWDGDFRGEPVDDGVYVYQIMMEFDDGSTLLISGDVMLLR